MKKTFKYAIVTVGEPLKTIDVYDEPEFKQIIKGDKTDMNVYYCDSVTVQVWRDKSFFQIDGKIAKGPVGKYAELKALELLGPGQVCINDFRKRAK